MKPLLGAVMIVKNEEHCIARTLRSVQPFVEECTILDTGSTDKTVRVIEDTLGSGVRVFHEPFVDFATSRNRVLELHGDRTVFTLMLSADEVLEGGDVLRSHLDKHRDSTEGAFNVEMRSGDTRWHYPRILRAGGGWRYEGAVHECPIGPAGESTGAIVEGVTIVHSASDPARRLQRIRDFDVPTLRKQVNDESKSAAERSQPMFFLAQSLGVLADSVPDDPASPRLTYMMEAMSLYVRYAQVAEDPKNPKFDPVKAHYSYFHFLNLAGMAGILNNNEMIARLTPLAEAKPPIPEAAYSLAARSAVVDARQGLYRAEQAVKIARESSSLSHVPCDSRLVWMGLLLACECAKTLGRVEYCRKLADQGVAAGGAPLDFKEYLGV